MTDNGSKRPLTILTQQVSNVSFVYTFNVAAMHFSSGLSLHMAYYRTP